MKTKRICLECDEMNSLDNDTCRDCGASLKPTREEIIEREAESAEETN